jgi:hypothetical protein
MSIPGLGSTSGPSAANFSDANQSIQQTDSSQANGTAQTLDGNLFNLGEGATLSYQGSDFGATQAASLANSNAVNLAEYAIGNVSKTQQNLSDDLFTTEQSALNLAGEAQQGQGGTLVHGLIWIVGLTAGGVALYSIARLFGRKERTA